MAKTFRAHIPGLRAGARFFVTFAAIIVLMAATGRVAMAWYRRPQSASVPRWLVAAIWQDLVDALPYLAVLVSPLLAVIFVANVWQYRRQPKAAPTRALQLVLAVTALAVWIASVSFCESLVQRGTLPVWHDFRGGMNAAFMGSAIANLWYARYLVPALFAWPAAFYCLRLYARPALAQPPPGPVGFGLGFAGTCLLFAFLTHPVHAPRFPLPDLLVTTEGVNDPFGRFLRSVMVGLSGAPTQPRDILLGAHLPLDRAAEGAALLGLQMHTTSGEACAPHPWAADLDEHAINGTPTHTGLRDISRALWSKPDGRLNDILVFQLSLESFRGDDLAALNPRAPRALAPFINSLYEAAQTGSRAVIAAAQLWQGGVRSSQGLSAFACGLGGLPHGISLVRDLGNMPLRCLSDVLVDAGFKGVFAYGSDPNFDNMAPFLRYHGVDTWLTQATLPKNLPTGEWNAVSDRALLQQVLAHFGAAQAQPAFALVMTLSNHSPFQPPQDLDPQVAARVRQTLATHPNQARREDRPRLLTYAYTDHAVQEFFETLERSGLARRSIVVLHADHATGERFLWAPPGNDGITEEAKGRIPFLIVFPDALVNRAADPKGLRQAVANTHAAINQGPVSLNDVPLWLLSLLSSHPGLAKLPPDWRWHSLGGMTASPAFHAPANPSVRLWGINGINQLFFLDAAAQVTGQLEDIMTLTHPDELFTATQRLFGISALLADFLRGYGKRCASPAHIRMHAAAKASQTLK